MTAQSFAIAMGVGVAAAFVALTVRNLRLAGRMAVYRNRSRKFWMSAVLMDSPLAVILLSLLRRKN